MIDNTRICSNCGQPLEPDDAFCGECGHRVSSTHIETNQPEPTQKPSPPSVANRMPPPRPAPPSQPSNEKPEQKVKKLWLTVSILAGVLILAAVALFINESSDTETTRQSTAQANPVISQIKIANGDSFYEQNASAGKIFVVSGKVINQSVSPIRFIRVEATLYGPNDAFLTRQSAYAGHVIDRQQLKSWSISSIRLKMHTPYGHNPGEQLTGGGTLPFTIVFADLPDVGPSRYEVRVSDASAD